jgi:ADP-dependent NAD(P)H-hydrate dehydratase / NAD(P)H-hydrate epimerase
MKVLTAAQMREVDRRTSELGIPGLVLMENAGHRVVEFLVETFAPLADHRIAILCGKGNNGGDGMVVARQLFTRFHPRALHVALAAPPEELQGDALANYRMLGACGCPVSSVISPEMRQATLVIDALLGTGIRGPASGRALEWIREINTGFPLAEVVAVDIPSGLESDSAASAGEVARARYTVTFTAPKIGQALAPNCDRIGALRIAAIGSPPTLYQDDPSIFLSLVEPALVAPLFAPRQPAGHKGDYGHVLIVAGSPGKTGAAAMSGLAALRSGAGLVTVASPAAAISAIAAHAPELMAEALPDDHPFARLQELARGKDVLAIGPGLGTAPETVALVRRLVREMPRPCVVDADGLNALAASDFSGDGRVRILTPHPGEMARLTGRSTAEVQADRLGAARSFALAHHVTLVLKGHRTLLAFPDGRVWINPTGSPALATGGTGDILTGTIAGLLAQFPEDPDRAVAAAVYIHGLAGQLGAAELGDKSLIATDLLRFYPAAIHACLSNRI